MLGRIVNVIKESELDSLSASWVMARTSCLLSKQGTVVVNSGAARDRPMVRAATLESASGSEIDEPVFMKENVRLGPFQTQILECRTKPLLGKSVHVMVMPLKAGDLQLGGMAFPPRIACVTRIHKT